MTLRTEDLPTFGARFSPRDGAPPEERDAHTRAMLLRSFARSDTIAFVGAGASAPRGYPTWRDFTLQMLNSARESSAPGGGGSLADLEPWFRKLAGDEKVIGDEFMWLLGRAERSMQAATGSDTRFLEAAAALYAPHEASVPAEHDPLAALADLKPVRRFITTNYDIEIERALAAGRGIPLEQFGIGRGDRGADAEDAPLSFTQGPERSDLIAAFSTSRGDPARVRVFHCHGRYDEPGTIVATEASYQRWYVTDADPRSATFQQTLRLVLTSSPILFVGYSLGEEDILRPLRMLAALDRSRKVARPLFALFAEQEAERVRVERLRERYGIHTVTYSSPGKDPAERGAALARAIRSLRDDSLAWWDRWCEKPRLRRVSVRARPPQSFWHYHPVLDSDPAHGWVLAAPRVEATVDRLCHEARTGARIICIVGPAGCGKSWHAIEILKRFGAGVGEFQGTFFWSSYYTNDRVTGVERLLRYLDPEPGDSRDLVPRLVRAVSRTAALIVLDGFERLLRPSAVPGEGVAAVPGLAELLRVFAGTGSKCTLVLTSRLWPRVLDRQELGAKSGRIVRHAIERMTTSDLDSVPVFARLTGDQRSEICSLLDGHAYGLALASRLLARATPEAREAEFDTLRRALAYRGPEQRLDVIIDLAVERAERVHPGRAVALLERIAQFLGPVTFAVVEACDVPGRGAVSGSTRETSEVLDDLLAWRLVLRVEAGAGEGKPPAFNVHPTVRGYVLGRRHGGDRENLPSFPLAGATSDAPPVHPGARAGRAAIESTFDSIRAAIDRERAAGRLDGARTLLRGLFGIVRSRMEANTASRWTTYPEYLRRVMGVAELAQSLSPGRWRHCDPRDEGLYEDFASALYADEVAWLYNDIGLALCHEGDVVAAKSWWEQGYEVNRLVERGAPGRQYERQSKLHLAHTAIDQGRLDAATRHLDECDVLAHGERDRDFERRVCGYRGLVSHLRGDLEAAQAAYERATAAGRSARSNTRAGPIFRFHLAALLVRRGDPERAMEIAESAEAVSLSGGHTDLVSRAWLTRATCMRALGRHAHAIVLLGRCRDWAMRTGCRRLESEAYSELARVALDLGDGMTARDRATTSLRIANECGLGLRQTHGLVTLGRASIASGLQELGEACLGHAIMRGTAQGYLLMVREAEETMQRHTRVPRTDCDLSPSGHVAEGGSVRKPPK